MTGDARSIRDFHAHIYYDPAGVDRAKALAAEVQQRFGVAVGHFHLSPVGPHPRGSCQMTVPTERFGAIVTWLSVHRAGLTIFAHASTGDDRADHTSNVIWFGPSEELNLSIFDCALMKKGDPLRSRPSHPQALQDTHEITPVPPPRQGSSFLFAELDPGSSPG